MKGISLKVKNTVKIIISRYDGAKACESAMSTSSARERTTKQKSKVETILPLESYMYRMVKKNPLSF